jgi:hypothetical protein
LLKTRKAIIDWVGGKESPKLPKVDAQAKASDGGGTVSVNFEDGYLLLVPEGAAVDKGTRVVWAKGDRETKRPIAAGAYKLRHYVLSRRDDTGVEWNVWGTGEGREVVVKPGANTAVEIDLDVTLKNATKRNRDKVMIGGNFSGDSGMGVSLVKDKRRIVVGWKLEADGKELGSGAAAYG